MSLSGKPAVTAQPSAGTTLAVTDSVADSGRVQEQRSEREPGDSALRKKNQEAKALRNELHALRAQHDQIKKEAADREAAEAAKRGEFESLYHSMKSQYDTLYREHADTILQHALHKRIGSKKVKEDAVEDVLRLLPKDGLRLRDGDVEGLDEALDEFLSKRPWLLVEAGDSGVATPGDPEGVWAEARQVGYSPSGHSGYRPSGQGTGRLPITDEMREDADRRGMTVEDWREVLEHRIAMLAESGR